MDIVKGITEKKEKKRSANFTNTELEFLHKLCMKYFNIIENKTSDAVSWQVKNAQWDKIAVEFNSQHTTNRCSKVLKKKWENMKKLVKDKVAGHRKYSMATGGGPPLPELKLNNWEQEILDHIKLSAVGLPSIYDNDTTEGGKDNTEIIIEATNIDIIQETDDTVISESIPEVEIVSPIIDETITEIIFDSKKRKMEVNAITENNKFVLQTGDKQPSTSSASMDNQNNIKSWATYNPAMLRSPITNKLKNKEVDPRLCTADQPVRYRKRPFTSAATNKAWTELAEEKKNIASMKKEKLEGDIRLQKALLEESDLRKEKLKIEIELLKLELELKKK